MVGKLKHAALFCRRGERNIAQIIQNAPLSTQSAELVDPCLCALLIMALSKNNQSALWVSSTSLWLQKCVESLANLFKCQTNRLVSKNLVRLFDDCAKQDALCLRCS